MQTAALETSKTKRFLIVLPENYKIYFNFIHGTDFAAEKQTKTNKQARTKGKKTRTFK